jgi:hypothetical protein
LHSPGSRHLVADAAQQRLEPRGAEHRVVDVVLVGGLETVVALVPGGLVGVVEDDELELGADEGGEPPLGEPVELAAQDLPRRNRDRAALHALDVGEDQGGAVVPGDLPQRLEVGAQHEVAVAAVPRRERVAADGVHVDVDGQEVVAGFGGVADDLVQEVFGGAALALEPALHVRQRDEHGVDRARVHARPEFVEREHASPACHPSPQRFGMNPLPVLPTR